ncbi:hypothetical protein EVAR_74970_1 [Eumeta japonica]|uniref:MADF domain-containing protein n=1 Tax=Eumeta variegata TaxID=151549 RepID=A0A4C1UJD9_EUMVA|nr:hypothetical protein EVAR_74970_1 [Eumeta japonica]
MKRACLYGSQLAVRSQHVCRRMYVAAMTFDTEKFIWEIESGKAIWDITSEEYSDRDLKKRRWEEIMNKMCSESLSENEKKEFGKSLQSKWKNIRTSYSREVKRRAGIKSGSAASRKSPYVYFEQLHFLRPTVVINETQNSMDETRTAETNANSGSTQGERPVSKKKKTSDDHNLVQNLVRFANVMLIMNQGHRPPDHIDHKHRSVDDIAKVKDTRLNMDQKPQAVGSIAMDTRHTRIKDQKPRPLKAAVSILWLFQTGKTIQFILMRYHQLTQMQ